MDMNGGTKSTSELTRRVTVHSIDAILRPEKANPDQTDDDDHSKTSDSELIGKSIIAFLLRHGLFFVLFFFIFIFILKYQFLLYYSFVQNLHL